MVFPISGVEVSPFIPPLVALGLSFFTSMGGVSGAFLLLPFQMSVLGFTSPAVSSTNLVYNLVAIPSGVYRYLREGRMVWPLTWIIILGTLPGVFIGALLRIRYLPDPKAFKFFAGLVLLYIGIRLVMALRATGSAASTQSSAEARFHQRVASEKAGLHDKKKRNFSPDTRIRTVSFGLSRLTYSFLEDTFTVSTPALAALSFIVGIVGGTYGIGGGAIIAPFLVTFFRLPVYTVAGSALMGTLVTSVAGVVFYQLIAPLYSGMRIAPDWFLGFLFGLGGFAGMYLGARCQKFVPARYLKGMLALIILITALKYMWEFIR